MEGMEPQQTGMEPRQLGIMPQQPGMGPQYNEKIEDLQCGGLKIIVRRDGFHYGTDSVLLANFVKASSSGHIVELCSGSGAVSILLSAKTRALHITGLEIQQHLVEMSNRSAILNGIDGKVKFLHCDIRDIRSRISTDRRISLGAGTANAVVSNPPYMCRGSGPDGPDEGMAIARRELCCELTDVTGAAKWLLTNGGSFYMVFKPERLTDLLCAMRGAGIEPKEIQPAGTSPGKPPSLILVRGVKGASPGICHMAQIGVQSGSPRS